MANEVKHIYDLVDMVITLASLADSSARQSTLIDNSSNGYQAVRISVSVTLGTNPSEGTVNVYALLGDGDSTTPTRTDGAGASDAAITILNAIPIGFLYTGASPSTGDVLKGVFEIMDPGQEFGVAIENNSGVALNSTGSNHKVRYQGINPEIQ